MKKWQKALIVSTSLLTPIIPTAALLSSCSSTNISGNLNADWTTTFENVKDFTGINTSEELIEKLSTTNSDLEKLLKRICIALKINVPTNNEVRLEGNKIIRKDNALFFTILVGLNLDDNNTLNIKKYSASITNLVDNNNSIPILNNDLVNSNAYNNNFNSIYAMNLVDAKERNIEPVQASKYTSDSEVVQNYLNNGDSAIPYTLAVNGQQESNLKTDLEYFIKESFFNNFRSWNIPSFQIENYNNFASVKISQLARNGSVAAELCLQVKNSSNSTKDFKFLNQTFNLYPNDVLTIQVQINEITRDNLLEVNYNGDVGLKLKNVILSSQISNSNIHRVENLTLRINRSFSVNTKLLNVTGNNNPFNQETIKDFEEIFKSNSDKLTTDTLKQTAQENIQKLFKLKKQEALINAKIIEKFAIPALYTTIPAEYDKNGDGIYSLFDLLANLGEPLSDWYKLKGLPEAADIISNIFSDKPLYLAFHDLFESLMKLLRSINSPIVNDILNFVEQSLTINGKVKSEQQFKEFFINISNLKEVVTPLLVNSGSISGYQLESILKLIDTLANPDKNIWIWLSENFNSIIQLANIFISKSTLPDFVKNIIAGVGKVEVSYNGQKVNNLITDVPLYNFLSREGLTITNPIKVIGTALALGDLIFNKVFDAIGLKETDIVSSIGIMFIKQSLRILGGQKNNKMKASDWGNAFKSYWIPKEFNGTANTTKSIYDIILEDENAYTLSNISWSILENNATPLNEYALNEKLSFKVNLPNMKFDIISSSNKATTKSTENITYNYFFSNSSATPIIRNADNNYFVDVSLPSYINTTGVCLGMCLASQTFDLFNLTNELTKDNRFYNYSANVYDDKKVLTLSKNNVAFTPSITSSDLISIPNISELKNYRLLTKSGYEKIINQLNQYSPNINLNDITLRPSIYIHVTGIIKSTYTLYLNFSNNIWVKEYDSKDKVEKIVSKNSVSLNVSVKGKWFW